MRKNSTGRRSSTNPVRISVFDREDKSLTRTDSRRTQTVKPKAATSSSDASHIPRPRNRASSSDRGSSRSSFLKATGKTPLHQYAPTTPVTPVAHGSKHSVGFNAGGSSNRFNAGLPTGRRSLSADRASNIGGKGARKDTRPLTDKVYQMHMLSRIENYFSVNQRSSMLGNNVNLKTITLKTFVDLSAYLLKVLDIKQVLTGTNYVEELPKIAKKLHYPGVITKSWLKTANTMHSWPNVLGWLCWLVDICEIRELAFQKYSLDNLPFMGTEKQAEINRNAFFSMLNLYSAWNDEKLDEEAALLEKYLQEIESQQGVTEEDLHKAEAELEEEILKLQVADENTNKIDDEVKHLKEVLTSLQKDEAKQLNDINAKEEYIKTINIETDQINAECQTLSEQIRLQNAQYNELMSTIKQQPMSKIERDKILEKCMEIQNYIHQFDDHLQEIRKELYTLDIKLASVNNNLNKTVLTYNKEIFMHLSNDIGIDLEELKMPEKGILHPQIMDVLNAKADLMNDLKELLKKQKAEKESLIESDTVKLETLQERIKALQDENNDIADKLIKQKTHINKIKIEAKSEETRIREQIKILQNNIKEIQESMPNLQTAMAELEEAADKLDAVRRKKLFIEQSAKLFFDKFYEILGEHRSELYNILAKRQQAIA